MRELEKLPTPVPSVVFSLEIVGEDQVLQHTPFAVIVAPPSEEMLPPLVAEVVVIDVAVVVVKVGT